MAINDHETDGCAAIGDGLYNFDGGGHPDYDPCLKASAPLYTNLARTSGNVESKGFGLPNFIRNSIRRFGGDEKAAITVAFVLWVPVFVSILALTVDATVLYISQANMWSVARDTTRFMAAGLYSNAGAEAYAAAKLPDWGEQSTIVASRNANIVTINITVPIGEIAPFNISGLFTSGSLGVELSQRIEPY